MHIKEVNITGFRSYREAYCCESFSRKHNVVVGRNGSGKSNFFLAIQFVLSEEFAHLKADARQALLHEGVGPKVTTARVEIVFDNSDRRITGIDSREVRIVRQIGMKKDQYLIDNKLVTRAEVVNMMESAGFSKSNPYYIVKQGKINELATAPESYRLRLLKEVAGTRVYDERKEESQKILNETNVKMARIETLLTYINDRLKTLEEEKEDLKEYQKLDKTKRAVEYAIYDLEVRDARKKFDKVSQQREELNSRQNEVETDLMQIRNDIAETETKIRKLHARFKGMKEERKILDAEKAERFQKKTQLELSIKDLKEDVELERSGIKNAEADLEQINREIVAKQNDLKEVTPKFETIVKEEQDLQTELRIKDQRYKELYAKLGYSDRFTDIKERDEHLQREIAFTTQQRFETQKQIKDIQNTIAEDDSAIEKLQQEVNDINESAHTCHADIERIGNQQSTLKSDFEQAVVTYNNGMREDKDIRDSLVAAQNEISSVEHDLRRIVAKPMMDGMDSIKKAVEYFKANNRDGQYTEVIHGYHGCLIDLIRCDDVYYQAIEVTAGNRLFFHVVENDKVAMKLLHHVNQSDSPGEINFFPLNRLVAPQRRSTDDEDARAMLDCIAYDPRFDAVMRNVFASTAIVRNLSAGARLARTEQFDCVTLEGDQVSRRGPMTGGYVDIKKSRLELHQRIQNLKEAKRQLNDKLTEAIQLTSERQNNVENIRLEISRVEFELDRKRQDYRNLVNTRRSLHEQISHIQHTKGPKNAQIQVLRNRMKEQEAFIENLQKDVGTALQTQLTSAEQTEVEQLEEFLKTQRKKLTNVTKERLALEQRKERLESQLNSNLLKKRENLCEKLNDISVEEKRHDLGAANAELRSVNDRLSTIQQRLADLDVNLIEYEENENKLTNDLEQLQEKRSSLDNMLEDMSKNADIFCTKAAAYQTKKEEATRRIRELGAVPQEAFTKYSGCRMTELDSQLTLCIKELKKYGNVNKKALDQFVRASAQKEDLEKRMEEQLRSREAINDLLTVLENRKYDAIQLTFNVVSDNFQKVFAKLVPGGRATLIMITRPEGSESGDVPRNEHLVETFQGIGIKVSFTGTEETRQMEHLSGGQKSLVALALIFAIQKCDPAPFYLFDEIDAALDAQHRSAVAEMLHEFSETAQFITTTFRSELLQYADKFYGVRFRNKVSRIDVVSRDQAQDFVEDDTLHS
uniref:Structural maintenance of chromosomes protein n=1 Tax=Steinernema glaseri TaxID=37863 RepID=A0A1I7YP81_9BILA